jgi:hypothetical protein
MESTHKKLAELNQVGKMIKRQAWLKKNRWCVIIRRVMIRYG